MTPIKVKFAREIGTRVSLRIYWGDDCAVGGYHNAMLKLYDELHPLVIGDREHKGGDPDDYPDAVWPKVCDNCGIPVPLIGMPLIGINRQVFNERLYDTKSGLPEPGSLFYAHWMPLNMEWDNKTDYNLLAICPDSYEWNIDSRASNCTMKDDRLHRCWCRHGDPETGDIHVDKNGLTCSAGGGSILTRGGWHGFLHAGNFQ